VASRPSISGIITSISTKSTPGLLSRRSKHSCALFAGSTRAPYRSSRLVTAYRLCTSSSTSRTVQPRSSAGACGGLGWAGGGGSVGAEFDLDRERDPPRRRELEGVGEQVLQHLLQSRCVGEDHSRDRRRDRDRELDPRRKGGPERALERLGYLADLHRADVHLQPSGLDLREVEDLVDEREQVLPAGVDGRRILHFLRVERAARVLRQQAGQDEHAVQRRAQLVRHVGEKLRLVAGDERELARLVLQVAGALRQLCV